MNNPSKFTLNLVITLILFGFGIAKLKNEAELNGSTFIAAVVEYKPNGTPWNTPPSELILRNVNHYVELIQEASELNADIIVFPEYGITTLGIPRNREAARPYLLQVPDINNNPCNDSPFNNTNAIQILSCAAKNYGIYVVVNLGEIIPCNNDKDDECPEDGFLQYNTNVVFNRFGEIVSKYHKTHLYFEEQFNSPIIAEHAIFTTDFNVTFGHFICYDIIFYNPAVELIGKGIQNIIYTSAWVDELPFLMAVQSQALWASAAGINLLASGYHQPLGGQLGSGIFSSTLGPLNYTFDPDSGTTLVIAQVPKIPGQIDKDISSSLHLKPLSVSVVAADLSYSTSSASYHSYLKENLTNYSSIILDLKDTSEQQASLCHGNFCCTTKFQMSSIIKGTTNNNNNNNSDTLKNYRLIAFDGIRKTAQETAEFGWQVCAVIRCQNLTLESCSFRDDNNNGDNINDLERFVYFELEGKPFSNGIMKPTLNTLDIYFDVIPFEYFDIENDIENGTYKISSSNIVDYSVQSISIINRIY